MARYIYTAQRNDGDVYRGVVEARDRTEVFAQIRREGAQVMNIKEDTSTSPWNWRYWNARFASVPEHDKVRFAQTLSAMLKAGLALSRALAVFERQTKNPKFAMIMADIQAAVRRGSTLNAALAEFPAVFSKLFVAMVRAGEETGDLPGALRIVGTQMENSYTLKKKIRGAMIYPAIIVVAIVVIFILMMTQVVPTLAATFEELNTDLPAATRGIIATSDFLIGNSLLAMSLFVMIVGGAVFFFRTPVGRRTRDFMFLHAPLIGELVREVNAARMARTLSSLLSAGVDMITAITITRDVLQNSYFKEILAKAEVGVQQGEPLSRPFVANDKLFPPLVGEMVAVGEETGDLSHMLENLAKFYEGEVSRQTKDMSTIIEPFLMVLIGTAVGFFAYAMVVPIYSLSDAI